MESKGGIPIVKPITQDLQVFSGSKILETHPKLIEIERPGLRVILGGLKWWDWKLWNIIGRER